MKNQIEDPEAVKWAKGMFRDTALSILPLIAIALGLPALGSWVLYFSYDPLSSASLELGWVVLLLVVVVSSSLYVPIAAVNYRSFLSRRGAVLRGFALAMSAFYSVTFGVLFAAVLRRFTQTEAAFFLPFVGYFTYCALVSSWFVKLPFDVEVRRREDAAKTLPYAPPVDS